MSLDKGDLTGSQNITTAKSLELEFNFTDNESFLFEDPFYDHPIQYEFVAYNHQKGRFRKGDNYDVSLYLVNTSSDKIIKGFIYSDISVFEPPVERGDFYYLRYNLYPNEKAEIVLINRVIYGESVIRASINFWEGPFLGDLARIN